MPEESTQPIDQWWDNLQSIPLAELVDDPEQVALFSADMINGFLRFGALSSPRVNTLTEQVTNLVRRLCEQDVRNFVFLQDTHDPNTPEFRSWPPHAEVGSGESHMISELADLPFADHFTIIEKNSLNPAIGTTFDHWLAEHEYITNAIVVGNGTDLCVYQLAMHLRLHANAHNKSLFDVIVPESCVETFDTPNHPGDFFHKTFLYHMSLNGIRVVRDLT